MGSRMPRFHFHLCALLRGAKMETWRKQPWQRWRATCFWWAQMCKLSPRCAIDDKSNDVQEVPWPRGPPLEGDGRRGGVRAGDFSRPNRRCSTSRSLVFLRTMRRICQKKHALSTWSKAFSKSVVSTSPEAWCPSPLRSEWTMAPQPWRVPKPSCVERKKKSCPSASVASRVIQETMGLGPGSWRGRPPHRTEHGLVRPCFQGSWNIKCAVGQVLTGTLQVWTE